MAGEAAAAAAVSGNGSHHELRQTITPKAGNRVLGQGSVKVKDGGIVAFIACMVQAIDIAHLHRVLADDSGHVIEDRIGFRPRRHVDPSLRAEIDESASWRAVDLKIRFGKRSIRRQLAR